MRPKALDKLSAISIMSTPNPWPLVTGEIPIKLVSLKYFAQLSSGAWDVKRKKIRRHEYLQMTNQLLVHPKCKIFFGTLSICVFFYYYVRYLILIFIIYDSWSPGGKGFFFIKTLK